MTEAPDKIWAGNDGYANRWDWDTPNDWPEYTRSDIADARIAELDREVSELKDTIEGLYRDLAGASL
jgi:hypothetical protein